MVLHDEVQIFQPVDRVYEAFQASLEHLTNWLPLIDSIQVSRSESAGPERTDISCIWTIDVEATPLLLKSFIRQNLKYLHSTMAWNAETREIGFEMYHNDFRNLFSCKGSIALVEQPPISMRMVIDAELQFYPVRQEGLDAWIARRSTPFIEKIFSEVVFPTLRAIPAAVQAATAIAEVPGGFGTSKVANTSSPLVSSTALKLGSGR